MSLGAEIFMQRALAELGQRDGAEGVAVLSRYGCACPGAETVAPVVRVAAVPIGGIRLRPAAVHAPPASFGSEDADRILRRYPVVVDARGLDPQVLNDLPDRPALLRRRGGADETPDGMELAFLDEVGEDVVFARAGLDISAAKADLDPAMAGFADEFAALRIDPSRGVAVARRFDRGAMEIGVSPASCLRAPDAAQIGEALISGRAVGDQAGRIDLALPGFSAAAARWRIEIADGGPLSGVAGEGAADIRVDAAPDRGVVSGTMEPGVEVAFVDLLAESAATVTAIWIAVERRKGRWEVWDEADAQLRLEESW